MGKTRLAGFLLFALLATACNRGKKAEEPSGAGASDTTAQSAGPAAPAYSEAQAIQILRAIDSARVMVAQLVLERSQNDNILAYARVVRSDHRAITVMLDSLLAAAGQTPADSPLGLQVRSSAEEFVTMMAARDTGFNNAYIAREVSDNEQALAWLDGELIPSLKTAELKTAVEQLRPAYQAHLLRAMQIREGRRNAPPYRPPVVAPPDTALIDTVRVARLR